MSVPIEIEEPIFHTDAYGEQYLIYQCRVWHIVLRDSLYQEVMAALKAYFRLIPIPSLVFIIDGQKYLGTAMDWKSNFRFYQAIPVTLIFASPGKLPEGLKTQFRSWLFFYHLLKYEFKFENFYITQYRNKLHLLGSRETHVRRQFRQYGFDWYLFSRIYRESVPEEMIDDKTGQYLAVNTRSELRKILGQICPIKLLDWTRLLQTIIHRIDPSESISADQIQEQLKELINFETHDSTPVLELPEFSQPSEIEKGPERIISYYRGESLIKWVAWEYGNVKWEFSEEGQILAGGEVRRVTVYASNSGTGFFPYIVCQRKKIRVDKLIWSLFWGYSSFPSNLEIKPADGRSENVALDNLVVSRKNAKSGSIAITRINVETGREKWFKSKREAAQSTPGMSVKEITQLINSKREKDGYRWKICYDF
jgi:hypothetical protein